MKSDETSIATEIASPRRWVKNVLTVVGVNSSVSSVNSSV